MSVRACVCVCCSLGNPCGWRTAVKIPRGPGADPVRVRAPALQAGVHARLQPAGAHAALAVPHLPHRVPQHLRRLRRRPPHTGKQRANLCTRDDLIVQREEGGEGEEGGKKRGKVYYLIPQTNTEVKSSPSARAASFKRLICEPPQVQISCYQSFYSASSETMRFSRKHKSTTSVLHFLAV